MKNTKNKIYLISGLAVLSGLLFVLVPNWFRFLWGWQLLLLPFMAGILMVLVQDEDRSYKFLPKLIVGSIITSFTFIVIWQIIDFKPGNKLYIPEALYTASFLAAIIIFGGLIGIIIRGIALLIKKYENNKKK